MPQVDVRHLAQHGEQNAVETGDPARDPDDRIPFVQTGRTIDLAALGAISAAVSGVISSRPFRISETACDGRPRISANSATVRPRASDSSRR
jgi:hypothetical protein